MTFPTKLFAVCVLVPVLYCGCERKTSNAMQVSPEAPELRLLSISPSNASPRETIVIQGTGFAQSRFNNAIYFNGAKYVPDSLSSTSLYVKVPFFATTGSISVVIFQGNSSVPPVDSSNSLPITIAAIDTSRYNLVCYDGPEITEYTSLARGPGYIPIPWVMKRTMDSVILRREYRAGDEGYVQEFLSFYIPAGDTVPRSVLGHIDFGSALSTRQFVYHAGIVAINVWNLSDKISGRVSIFDQQDEETWPGAGWSDYYFWYKIQ